MSPVEHLYLQVPFRSVSRRSESPVATAGDLERWASAVGLEFEDRGLADRLSTPLRTLHVGGVAPSVLGDGLAAQIGRLLGSERLSGIEEWSVEADPNDVDTTFLKGWRRSGVTRVSVGLGSLRPSVRSFLGLSGGADAGLEALSAAASAGLETWGVDLMYGLPAEIDPDPTGGLEEVVRMNPPHVCLYEFISDEDRSREFSDPRPDDVPGDDERADLYLELTSLLEREGYRAYEMTAFCRPGQESRHLRAVLAGAPFIGVGPGAVSRVGGRVRENARNWLEYQHTLSSNVQRSGGSGAADSEGCVEEPEDPLVGLQDRLRLREGVPLDLLSEHGRALADRWIGCGWAHADPDRLRCTPEGWLRLDSLVIELDRAGGTQNSTERDQEGREPG